MADKVLSGLDPEKLAEHAGHVPAVVVAYGSPRDPDNVAVECLLCYAIVLDGDAEGETDDVYRVLIGHVGDKVSVSRDGIRCLVHETDELSFVRNDLQFGTPVARSEERAPTNTRGGRRLD